MVAILEKPDFADMRSFALLPAERKRRTSSSRDGW
jgi:hypothetical protein